MNHETNSMSLELEGSGEEGFGCRGKIGDNTESRSRRDAARVDQSGNICGEM